MQRRLFEDYIVPYKLIGILGSAQALMLLIMGICSGPFANPGSIYANLRESDIAVGIISAVEIAAAAIYLFAIVYAFLHDLFYEKKATHLLIVLALEFFVFSVLKVFLVLGGNLILFIGIGILLCFLIGGSSLGLVMCFDWILTGGIVVLLPVLKLVLVLLSASVAIKTFFEFFA